MKANLNFLTFKTEASTPEIVAASWNKVTYLGSLLKTKPKTINAIIDKKVKKYGVCNTIMIRNILGHESAILLQNAFPTLEKYIDHIHVLENGKPAKVIDTICDEILENFNQIMKLKRIGINLFFTNIDYIKEKMLDELKID